LRRALALVSNAEALVHGSQFQNRYSACFKDRALSFLSLSSNLLWHRIASYKVSLEKGTLIVSIDVDVGNGALGRLNQGQNDRNVSSCFSERAVGEFEEASVPLLMNLLEEVEVPATFAVRGQLLEVDNTLLDTLLESSVKHDIAAHGYYHMEFDKLSRVDTETELEMISQRMKEFNIAPKTFVFPRNRVAYLELLEERGYLCYRGAGGFAKNGMYIAKHGGLYDVHPSVFVNRNTNVKLLEKMLDLSISKSAPFHLWFHPLDFGPNERNVWKNINQTLRPFLAYSKLKERDGLLEFHTMRSIAEQLERSADNRELR
jgi:peptidoglycan/xylan/chitin deacetylase (PgdA/CDA1 family)